MAGGALRVLIIEHDHLSPPGPIAERLQQVGFEITEIQVVPAQLFHTPNVAFDFPVGAELSTYQLIVSLGAPWGAWDNGSIGNWLVPEMGCLKEAMLLDIPILGICFGGQLLARTLGGEITQSLRAEIGWGLIHSDLPEFISPGPWFQFHYDQWSLPPGAIEIARNSIGSQAFVSGKNLAVQFHPDITAAGLLGWLENGGYSKVEEDGQDPHVLQELTQTAESGSRERTFQLVDYFLQNIAQLK